MDNRYKSFEEQNELVKRSISGDEAATVELINLCYPIAGKIAKRFRLSPVDYQDLLQEAMFGVLLAIPRYRPDMGTKFTTYCTFWMQKKMRKYAETNRIRCPEGKIEELKDLSGFMQEFLIEHGREPSDAEIMEVTGISEEKLQIFRSMPVSYLVLEEVAAFIPSGTEGIEDVAVLHVLLEEALEIVNEQERYVLIQHFGLFSTQQKTFVEIARDLHCSKEWARHLEMTGLRKMKDYLSRVGFQE